MQRTGRDKGSASYDGCGGADFFKHDVSWVSY
jgi:hypothetical protein